MSGVGRRGVGRRPDFAVISDVDVPGDDLSSDVLRERAVDFLNLERTECSELAVQGVSDKLTIPVVTIGCGIMYIMYRRG